MTDFFPRSLREIPLRCARSPSRNLLQRSRGFTLIELIVTVVVICVLGSFAVNRYRYYEEQAEKTAMDATMQAIKSGLQIRLAELLLTNRQMVASDLERENPMRWLVDPPGNYEAQYQAPGKPGTWYFVEQDHQLAYVPNLHSHLKMDNNDSRELRFDIKIRYSETGIPGGKAPTGVVVVPVTAYEWF